MNKAMIALVAFAIVSLPVGTVSRLQPARSDPLAVGWTSASTNPEGGVTQDAAEALAADLEAIGEAHGWTAKQLAAYEASEAALDAVSERLSTEHPRAFVGTVLAEDPMDPPTAYVKGRASADVLAIAKELGVALVEDQPYSLDELDARLAIVHDAFTRAGLEDVVGWADIQREGAITVVVGGASRASLDPVVDGIAPEVAKDITALVATDRVAEDQGAFGGMKLQGR